MNKRAMLGNGSSPLVSTPAIIIFLAAGIAAAIAKYFLLSGLMIFISLLGIIVRLWGRSAIKNVHVSVKCNKTRLFPGNTTEIKYTVTNDKFLPLIWLELSQAMPENNCLEPDINFKTKFKSDEKDFSIQIPTALEQTFSFIMGWQTINITSTWTAKRRGLYPMRNFIIRSGDCFGLTHTETEIPNSKLPIIAVYPKFVNVNVASMLQNQWDSSIGTSGYAEDMSVLRGLRPYQVSDSWKRINWRMLAKQQSMNVNIYETIKPNSILFVLDGESFCELSDDFEALENALEILSSLITVLFSCGITCGLFLPVSKNFGAISLEPDENRTMEELLFYLAGYNCLMQRAKKDNLPPEECPLIPSVFDGNALLGASLNSGKTYYITHDSGSVNLPSLDMLDSNKTIILADIVSDMQKTLDIPVLPLQSFKEDGK